MREIDRTARTPPWQQIAADLREEIAAGRYAPDELLPSIERLVQMYGVNRKTARKALVSLADEGLAEAVSGMGYYVTGAQ